MAANVAFEILYKEYYVRVYGLCRRLLNSPTLAEDATQEAFMRAYRSFDKYDHNQPFWQWIASIASNHCIDVLRRQNKTKVLFGEEDTELNELESADSGVLAQLIDAESAGNLSAAMETLPDKYRVPLVLAYFNESSYDQIADDLGITRSHVGVLLLRGKQHLRKALAASDAAAGGQS